MAVKPVIDLITKIFGKKALSKTIGTRTNVITLPDSDVKRIIKNELDITKASDAQLEVFRNRAEQLIPDIPKMNDQELLTFKGNLQRYYNKMYPPSAQVFDFETKRKFSPKGIEQLETEVGLPSDVDVKSPLGRMLQESKFNLKDVGKIFDETAQAQSSFIKMQNERLVRATAREIMERDIKSGKLQIPKEEMQVITEYSSVNDPIDIWRKYYGEDALEQLDSMVPNFYEMRTSSEAADAATKKFNFEPKLDRLPGSFDPDKPPEFAYGGRVHAAGGLMKGMIDWLVKNRNFTKELLDRVSKQKNGEKLIKELYESETKKSGVSPMSMGEAPKTNLPKVRAQKKADEEGIKQLAQDEQIPVRDDTIIPEDVMTVPEPFKGKYKDEFLAHDALYGRRSGDNKVDAEAIAETVADMQGKVYDDLGYTERMDLYDKAYGYLSLLDRTQGAMKEARTSSKLGDLKVSKGVAPEATSAEKLYDEYIYYRDELKNFTGSFDDFIIARRKAGSLLAEETPLSNEAVKRKLNAGGGLAYLMGL